jgi:hypothetical protein
MTTTKSSGTVGPIIFSNKIARQQLLTDGEVVTFRKSPRTTGETWWRESRLGPKQGDVAVRQICEIDPQDESKLAEYQELSGFESVQDWQLAIRNLNGTMPSSGHLYHVSKR